MFLLVSIQPHIRFDQRGVSDTCPKRLQVSLNGFHLQLPKTAGQPGRLARVEDSVARTLAAENL